MSKRQIIMVLGFITVLLPFLGFPLFLDTVITMVIGVLVIGFAYMLKPSEKFSKKMTDDRYSISPVENNRSDLPFVDHHNVEPTIK